MGKIILLLTTLAVLSTACSHQYTCTCTIPAVAADTSVTPHIAASPATNFSIHASNTSKKDAQTWCNGFGTIQGNPSGTSCEITSDKSVVLGNTW